MFCLEFTMKFSRLLSKFFGSSRKSRCLEKGAVLPLSTGSFDGRCVAECGVDGRCMALMGVAGRCGVVMIQRYSSPNGPVSFNGPVGHGEQDRQPPLIQGSEPGSLKEKLQMESTSTGRPRMLESQRFVTMVGVVSMVRTVRMVGEVESVAHL